MEQHILETVFETFLNIGFNFAILQLDENSEYFIDE